MIHFSLVCGQEHAFEAWFRNAGDFDAQAQAGQVMCPVCGATDVRKALMTPNVSTARGKAQPPINAPPAEARPEPAASQRGAAGAPTLAAVDPGRSEVATVLRMMRDTVVRNTDDVGTGFAEEARKMHYGEAEKRGIRGETNAREAHELREEGIEIMPLPSLPEDNN